MGKMGKENRKKGGKSDQAWERCPAVPNAPWKSLQCLSLSEHFAHIYTKGSNHPFQFILYAKQAVFKIICMTTPSFFARTSKSGLMNQFPFCRQGSLELIKNAEKVIGSLLHVLCPREEKCVGPTLQCPAFHAAH